MRTLNTYNICNKNINNIFDNIENRVQLLENSLNKLNKIKHIEFNYHKIFAINETLLNELNKIIDMQNIKITKLENDKFKNKIFEAITDMINCDNLDSKLYDISNDLIKIKTVRNSNSHYIKNIDSIDVKNKKNNKYYQPNIKKI